MEELSMDTGIGDQGSGGADETLSDEGQDGGSELSAKKLDAPKEEPKPEKVRAKINGEWREVTQDELDERIRQYSKAQAAHEAFEKASQMMRQTKALLKKLREDPESVLEDPRLGIDFEKLAEKRLLKKVNKLMEPELTPEERERRELEERLRQYEEKEMTEREKAEAEARFHRAEQHKKEFSELIGKVMESTDLQGDSYTMRAAAVFIKSCIKRGFMPDPDEVKEAIEGRVNNDYQARVKKLKGAALKKFLGDEVVQELRRADLEDLRAKRMTPREPSAQALGKPKEPKRVDKWDLIERTRRWAEES